MTKPVSEGEHAAYVALFENTVLAPEAATEFKQRLAKVALEAIEETRDPSQPTTPECRGVSSDGRHTYKLYNLPPNPYRAMVGETNRIFEEHTRPNSRYIPRNFAREVNIGVGALVFSLSTIGKIIAGNANDVPQARDTARDAVEEMERWTMKTAFSDVKTFDRNWAAMTTGLSPHSPLTVPLARLRRRFMFVPNDVVTNSLRSYSTEVDENGQVHVRPRRVDPVRFTGDRETHGCPAAHIGLWPFIQAVGDVVLDTVYPWQFPMEDKGGLIATSAITANNEERA